jgi:hypothetical protein
VNLFTSAPMTQSFRYSIDNRSISPNRSIAVSSNKPSNHHKIPDSRRRCMCSPTTHPGSFRCSLHKNVANPHGQGTASYTTNGLNMRRSAMTNSLVRIGGVEGEWVRRALTTLIRPSSHQLKRRSAYEPRRSRLASMSKAEDLWISLQVCSCFWYTQICHERVESRSRIGAESYRTESNSELSYTGPSYVKRWLRRHRFCFVGWEMRWWWCIVHTHIAYWSRTKKFRKSKVSRNLKMENSSDELGN